jgi:nucleoside-diphosphate-sugar epimerase
MNILITGSTGFVGSRLMIYLEEKGHTVWGIDNSNHCLRDVHPHNTFGDIRNVEDFDVFKDKDINMIIHCAASKHDFGISTDEYYSNNEYGTEVVMHFAKDQKVKKIIYYSTVSCYGHEAVPCDESGPLIPDNEYGASKLAGEKVIEKYVTEDPELEVFFLRPSIIYGPNNFANMYNLIAMQHRKFWVTIGEGSHIKSMVSLENLIDMTYWCFDRFKPGIQIYNTLDKPYITVKKLMHIIATHDGFSMPTVTVPLALAICVGKSTEYYSDKIREDGYVQKHSIEDQMSETIEWFVKNHHRRTELDVH